MKNSLSLYDISRLTAAVLLSFAAGTINGCVGTGSGIVFMLLWNLLAKDHDSRSRYSFAMTCVIVVSFVSLILYPAESSADLPMSALIAAAVCGVIGGAGGAFVAERVKISWLNRAFALLTIYSGLSMVLGR